MLAELLDNDKFMFYYFGPNTIEEKMKIECITAQQAPTRLAELAQLHAITAGRSKQMTNGVVHVML